MIGIARAFEREGRLHLHVCPDWDTKSGCKVAGRDDMKLVYPAAPSIVPSSLLGGLTQTIPTAAQWYAQCAEEALLLVRAYIRDHTETELTAIEGLTIT